MPRATPPGPPPSASGRRFGAVRLAWLLALLMGTATWACGSDDGPSREYLVKAAFVFSFAHFVSWPPPPAPASAVLRIGVLGDDPFGPALDETVRNEEVQGRKVAISRSHRIDELSDCQIIYISRSEADRLDPIMQRLGSRPILSISDMDGFAEHGGVIRLYVIGKKVRFEINQTVATRHQLKLDSQLLSLGKIITAAPVPSRP